MKGGENPLATKAENSKPAPKKRPPATSPESRENQLIELAVDLAEQQLRDGTASAQVQLHYLRMASSRDKLEREKLRLENNHLERKADQIESQVRNEEGYLEAIEAMRRYSGNRDAL